jgi:hypothetical protein
MLGSPHGPVGGQPCYEPPLATGPKLQEPIAVPSELENRVWPMHRRTMTANACKNPPQAEVGVSRFPARVPGAQLEGQPRLVFKALSIVDQ